MKNNIISICLLGLVTFSGNLKAQKWVCKNGNTSFFSETPLENISAINKNVASIIDQSTGSIAVKMKMTEFVFPNKLMQEHFNENYVESEKYPDGVFSGKVEGTYDLKKPGKYPIKGNGTLTLHGVKREVSIPGTLEVQNNEIILKCEFTVRPDDYKIDIPSLVLTKIAEEISVKSMLSYSLPQK